MPLTETESKSVESETSSGFSFWTGKHTASTVILIIFALVAAYLQYSLYPKLMTSTGGSGFGLKNVTVKLSFLTFQYSATRCTYSSCVRQVGVPAFDFFQAIIIIILVMNLFHLYYVKKTR